MTPTEQEGGKPMTNYNERLDDVLTELRSGTINFDDKAKQAITSLIKELVAEAMPEYISPDQPLGLKYQGRNEAIWEFEQNLLKALEEVSEMTPQTPAQLFKIKAPVWGSRSVGLATYKVGQHNEIRIETTNKEGALLYPQPLYISGEKARSYPIEPVKKNPNIKLYIIPINDLEVLERE